MRSLMRSLMQGSGVEKSTDGAMLVAARGGDIRPDHLWRVRTKADNNGDLTVKLRDTGDSITIASDLVSNWWGVGSRLQQITYADGTSQNVAQPGYNQGSPPTLTWIGSASVTTLAGSNYGSNVFDLGPGGDTVTFGNASQGASGANTLVFDKGDGQAQVALNGGTGTIRMASDIAASDVILQADAGGDLIVKLRDTTDSITIAHDLAAQWWGTSTQVSQIGFADGTSLTIGQPAYNQGPAPTFTWIGTAGNDTLTGNAFGNNVFEGGAGNDTLNGNGGYDTYKFTSGLGQSVVNNLASDGYAAKGEIDFAGVAHDQLWFQKSGNDLQIDLLGTNQDLTVSGWYGNNARAQVQSVDAGDGLKIDSQLQQLVSAMAAYSANNTGFDPTQATQMPADQTLHTTIAAAWH
jgi:Ca2+-binding RTX toxin-like protein